MLQHGTDDLVEVSLGVRCACCRFAVVVAPVRRPPGLADHKANFVGTAADVLNVAEGAHSLLKEAGRSVLQKLCVPVWVHVCEAEGRFSWDCSQLFTEECLQ